VDVAITKAFSLGAKTNGSTTGDGKFFKGNVSRDYLLAGSATSHADALTKPGQVTITGLTASALYTLEMYGSAVQSGTSSEFSTNYKAGGKTVTYLPLNNSVGVANLVGVMSDSTGKIVLDVAVTPNGTAKYAVLGGLRIVRE
jgi:hypothetical protein